MASILQLVQHALQCEVPIAVEREGLEFLRVLMLGHIEGYPATMAKVRRYAEALVRGQQA
jgi:hypothetical protein